MTRQIGGFEQEGAEGPRWLEMGNDGVNASRNWDSKDIVSTSVNVELLNTHYSATIGVRNGEGGLVAAAEANAGSAVGDNVGTVDFWVPDADDSSEQKTVLGSEQPPPFSTTLTIEVILNGLGGGEARFTGGVGNSDWIPFAGHSADPPDFTDIHNDLGGVSLDSDQVEISDPNDSLPEFDVVRETWGSHEPVWDGGEKYGRRTTVTWPVNYNHLSAEWPDSNYTMPGTSIEMDEENQVTNATISLDGGLSSGVNVDVEADVVDAGGTYRISWNGDAEEHRLDVQEYNTIPIDECGTWYPDTVSVSPGGSISLSTGRVEPEPGCVYGVIRVGGHVVDVFPDPGEDPVFVQYGVVPRSASGDPISLPRVTAVTDDGIHKPWQL